MAKIYKKAKLRTQLSSKPSVVDVINSEITPFLKKLNMLFDSYADIIGRIVYEEV